MLHPVEVIDKQDYIIIKRAFSSEMCELFAGYANLKARVKPNVWNNADPLQNIHREYGDALMETCLAQLTPWVEHAVGLELWPTLSFYYVYRTGNRLSVHTDRSSCQIVAGLCIGADDAYKKLHGAWPLWFNFKGRKEAVSIDYGDLVIFRGHEIEHWREVFSGEWFVSAIFGFVEKNGPYAFQKYDQRKMLGKPHVGMFFWAWGCIKNKLQNIWIFSKAQ
jgi:hypothetical protein